MLRSLVNVTNGDLWKRVLLTLYSSYVFSECRVLYLEIFGMKKSVCFGFFEVRREKAKAMDFRLK